MIYYAEKKKKRLSVFEKVVASDNDDISYRRFVEMPLYKIKRDSFLYYVLYNDDMEPISDVFGYLNVKMAESPENSRSVAATALRLLYCFLSLSTYNIDCLGEAEIHELLFFLRGVNANPEEYSTRTQRSNSTINGYLAVYRTYFKYLDIECDALFNSHKIPSSLIGEDKINQGNIRYDNNLPISAHKNDGVPKYISVDEFHRVYGVMSDAGDEQSMIIIHLMFGYGLRLGEVLGITLEDIAEVKQDGVLVPVIWLRNRLSDAKYQYCKGLPHVVSSEEYGSKDYRTAAEKIVLTYEFYEELVDFVNRNHSKMVQKYPDNYAKGTADTVSFRDKPESNHYVFLNRYGRSLTDQTWNNILRKYFEAAEIPIDSGVRDNNLSHKFRHGFAMFHARFSEHPVGILELQKMMRHKSLNSTMRYYNPTPKDESETKLEFQRELYKTIPELKKGKV